MDFASLWLQEDALERVSEPRLDSIGDLHLVAATPRFQFDVEGASGLLPLDEVRSLSAEDGFFLRREVSADQIPENVASQSADIAAFPVGRFGVLRLVSQTPGRLDERECKKLLRLVERFSQAVAACLSHSNALSENEERRRIQAEMAETSELLETLSDSLSVGVLVASGELEVVNVNATFCGLFGLDRDDVEGVPANDALEKFSSRFRDSAQFGDWATSAVAEGRPGKLRGIERNDGQILDVDYSPFGTEADRGGHLWQFRDVTESYRARERIEESEQRHRLLLQNALDAVVSIDSLGMVIGWNPQAEETFGFKKAEALGRRMSELIIPVSLQEAHESGMKNYLRTGEGPVLNKRIEIEARHRDGHEFPIELTIHPVEAGGEVSFTAFARDITERRVIEKMKDDLVSTVSHELRTPLTSMQGFVEMLIERDYPPERQKEFLRIVHSESIRLGRLVRDFLDIRRLQSGQVEYAQDPLDLGEIATEMVDVFRANPEGQIVELAVEPGLPPVIGDADRIRQVIANLTSNAIKFSDGPGTVAISIASDEGHVELVVSDEGLGVAEDEIDQLFDKFFRSEQARRRAIGGSGLGLALVQEIVEAHRGSIRVESKEGQGSSFFVRFPAGQ